MSIRASLTCGLSFFAAACGAAGEPEGEVARARERAAPHITILLHEDGVENAYPRLSRDGKRVLYQSNRTGKWQLWVMDFASRTQTRLTHDEFNDNFVDWSADNAWIAFVSDRDGNEELYRMRSDGSALERLTDDPARDIHPYFSPDGSALLFNSTRGNGTLDVYRLTLADRRVERVTDWPQSETCARYSPDMRTIVLLRNDEHEDDIALLDVKTGAVRNLTNTPLVVDGWPMFSADGKWIYYSTMLTGQHSVHRIRPDGTGDETLTTAAPREEDGRAFVSHDGKRIVFNKRSGKTIDIRALDLAS